MFPAPSLKTEHSPRLQQPSPWCGAASRSKWGWSGTQLRLGQLRQTARVPCCFSLLPLPRFHAALLFVLLIFKPEGTHPPGVRFQGQGAQYVAQTAPSPGRISVHVIPLLIGVPSPEQRSLIASLPFLPNSMWIFYIVLVVQESFCQSPVSFQ